jgi:hypothetical protein
MTNDEAISIGVRLDTALMALKEARGHVNAGEDDTTSEEVAEGLEEAIQAAETARALVRSVSGH